MRSQSWWFAVVFCAAAVGCDSSADAESSSRGDSLTDAAPTDADQPLIDAALVDAQPAGLTTSVARFEVAAEGSLPWGALPFPNDLYRDETGRVDLGTAPNDTAMWRAVLPGLAMRDGFCTVCATYFPIELAAGRALPVEDLMSAGREPSLADQVVLADIDPDSPEHGRLFPLRAEWYPDLGVLGIKPMPGLVLAVNRRYAVALTGDVLDSAGEPVQPAPLFASLRDGQPAADAAAQRAATVVVPGLAALADLGMDTTRIVSLAVFTTGDPSVLGRELRAAVLEAPRPVAVVEQVWRADDGTLEELLGTPAFWQPGDDTPAAEGTAGDLAMVHETTALIVAGYFESPRFVTGQGAEPGLPVWNFDGPPRLEKVPFLLIVPRGAPIDALPVVHFQSRNNGTRSRAVLLADTAGRAGAAVIATDRFLRGARSPDPVDEVHWLRGEAVATRGGLGPDGLVDPYADSFVLTAGYTDPDPARAGSPEFVLGVALQVFADDIATLRLLREGDVSAIADADPSLAELRFNPDQVLAFGYRNGTGGTAMLLALDDSAGAGVLCVPNTSLMHQLCLSPIARGWGGPGWVAYWGVELPEPESRHSCDLHPVVDFHRWVFEPADSIALAPRFFNSREHAPDLLIQLGSHDERTGPAMQHELIAAAGVPGRGDFGFATVEPVNGPVSGNIDTEGGPVTAAAWVFQDAGHGVCSRARMDQLYDPPLVPPFRERAEPRQVDAPVVAAHAQIEHFFRTRLTTGRAEILGP